MARPSLKEQRASEILDAFETCVARYGVEGATLERVADEAGLARALIRHNVGNREDLLKALVERYVARSEAAMKDLYDALPAQRRLETLIEWLFDPSYTDVTLVQVSEALIVASGDNPALAKAMRKWMRGFVAEMAKVVRSAHPAADEGAVNAAAAGLTGIYFNAESVAPLGRMTDLLKASKAAALMLVQGLDA